MCVLRDIARVPLPHSAKAIQLKQKVRKHLYCSFLVRSIMRKHQRKEEKEFHNI